MTVAGDRSQTESSDPRTTCVKRYIFGALTFLCTTTVLDQQHDELIWTKNIPFCIFASDGRGICVKQTSCSSVHPGISTCSVVLVCVSSGDIVSTSVSREGSAVASVARSSPARRTVRLAGLPFPPGGTTPGDAGGSSASSQRDILHPLAPATVEVQRSASHDADVLECSVKSDQCIKLILFDLDLRSGCLVSHVPSYHEKRTRPRPSCAGDVALLVTSKSL